MITIRAAKETIQPEDLWDKPLIISNQDDSKGTLTAWINKELSELEIVATYNPVFNASLMVEEGLRYAHCLEKIPGIFRSGRPFSKKCAGFFP